MKISNAAAAKIERLANATIHELVFLNHHVGDDQTESAQDTLIQARQNLDAIEVLMEGALHKYEKRQKQLGKVNTDAHRSGKAVKP